MAAETNANPAAIEREALARLAQIHDEAALSAWHNEFLGRKNGRVNALLRSLGSRPEAERRALGAQANQVKQAFEAAFEARKETLRRAKLEASIAAGRVDVTLPGRRPQIGRLHPVTQTLRDLLAALTDLGFQVAEGPEVETDYYNFEMLRIPRDHPARDMWDTMWLDPLVDGLRPLLAERDVTRGIAGAVRVALDADIGVRIGLRGQRHLVQYLPLVGVHGCDAGAEVNVDRFRHQRRRVLLRFWRLGRELEFLFRRRHPHLLRDRLVDLSQEVIVLGYGGCDRLVDIAALDPGEARLPEDPVEERRAAVETKHLRVVGQIGPLDGGQARPRRGVAQVFVERLVLHQQLHGLVVVPVGLHRAVHPALDERLNDIRVLLDEVFPRHHQIGDQVGGCLRRNQNVRPRSFLQRLSDIRLPAHGGIHLAGHEISAGIRRGVLPVQVLHDLRLGGIIQAGVLEAVLQQPVRGGEQRQRDPLAGEVLDPMDALIGDDGIAAAQPIIRRDRPLMQQPARVDELRHLKYEKMLENNQAITLVRGKARFTGAHSLAVTLAAAGGELEIGEKISLDIVTKVLAVRMLTPGQPVSISNDWPAGVTNNVA